MIQDKYVGKLKLSPREVVECLMEIGYSKYEIGRVLGMKSTGSIYKWINNPTIKPKIETAYRLYQRFNIVLDIYDNADELIELYEKKYREEK